MTGHGGVVFQMPQNLTRFFSERKIGVTEHEPLVEQLNQSRDTVSNSGKEKKGLG